MWRVESTSRHARFGVPLWWLVDDPNPHGGISYYPNQDVDRLSDYIQSEAEAQLLCDQLNIRDYGICEDVTNEQ